MNAAEPAASGSNPQFAGEQRTAARHLLQHPMTAKEQAPEEFALVRRHEAVLKRWFAQRLGYRLHVDSDTARLFKTGSVPSRPFRTGSGRSLRHREYLVLCLIMGSVTAGPSVVSLRELVERLRASAAEAGVELRDDPTERRATVTALQWMMQQGLAAEVDRHVQAYITDGQADAVLRFRLDRVALVPVPGVAGRDNAEALLAAAQRREVSRRWMRQLLVESPVLYRSALGDGEWGELRRRLGEESALLVEMFNLHLEARAEGVAAIDPSGDLSEPPFPVGGTVGHGALLLLERLRGHRSNPIPLPVVTAEVARLAAEHAKAWAKDLVNNPDQFVRRMLELLAAHDLIAVDGDLAGNPSGDGVVVTIRPASARFLPATRVVASSEEQTSLW